MDLPSAADQIVTHLKTLNETTAQIAKTLSNHTNPDDSVPSERMNQLESEIRSNALRDYIRQEVQNHHDQVLAQEINQALGQFSAELNQLQQQIDAVEQRLGKPDVQQEASGVESQVAGDAVPAPDHEAEPSPTTKRPAKGRASS